MGGKEKNGIELFVIGGNETDMRLEGNVYSGICKGITSSNSLGRENGMVGKEKEVE